MLFLCVNKAQVSVTLYLQTCRLLLGYGADASLVSLQGFTAAQMGNEAVQQILNGRSPFVCVCGWLGVQMCRCRVLVAMRQLATMGLTENVF